MIHNIHILTQPDSTDRTLIELAQLQQILIEAHRRSEHPYGSMRRDCPLCQLGK